MITFVAAPVVANATREQLRSEADDVECISAPDDFQSVGAWYRDFHEMSDAEVQAPWGGTLAVAYALPHGAGLAEPEHDHDHHEHAH